MAWRDRSPRDFKLPKYEPPDSRKQEDRIRQVLQEEREYRNRDNPPKRDKSYLAFASIFGLLCSYTTIKTIDEFSQGHYLGATVYGGLDLICLGLTIHKIREYRRSNKET